MVDFLWQHAHWVFSGIGLLAVSALVWFGRRLWSKFGPDTIKVRASCAVGNMGMLGVVDLLSITVQNHGNQEAFLDVVYLELTSGRQFTPQLDRFTGQGQARRHLRPGESFSFNFLVADIAESKLPIGAFRCVAVRDAVGRIHRSSEQELRNVLSAYADRRPGVE